MSTPNGFELLPQSIISHHPQLPTPQSPNTIEAYIGNGVDSPLVPWPIRNDASKSRPENSVSKVSAISKFMTPESSPHLNRNRALATVSTNPVIESSAISLKFNPVANPPLESLRVGDPSSSSSTRLPPHSRLSSPFSERLSVGSQTPKKGGSPSQGPSSPAPSHVNDIFTESTPLIAPSPQRLRDEESERIRLLLADQELVRIQEAEIRRPEYLVREKREGNLNADERQQMGESNIAVPGTPSSMNGLGIALTPLKGRRLKLFQETSEESFEESLMVNGYGYSGATAQPSDRLSQHTLEWLQQRSPGVIIPPSGLNTSLQERTVPVPLTDRDIKKRKRLAAFKPSSATDNDARVRNLSPVIVQGKGKVLVNKDEEEMFRDASEAEPTGSKRGGKRRKRKASDSPSKRRGTEDLSAEEPQPSGPDWIDSEFPWSLKAVEQAKRVQEDREERMRWVEKFLDRDTDEESEEGEEIMPSAAWGEVFENPPVPSKRGRGKMVPIKGEPERKERMFFPSDPADARAALLSKRAVRALAQRRLEEREEDEYSEGRGDRAGEVCICKGKTDSRALVQCEDCERWYHLRCVGIKNVEELGGDDDPWFCYCCVQNEQRSPTPELDFPSSEPVIVPTDDLSSPSKDPLFFEGSLEESPLPSWTTAGPPTTPVRGGRRLVQQYMDSSSSPSKGPYTPQNPSSVTTARVYATPVHAGDMQISESIFDPTSTPSRGIKFGTSFVTPKMTSAWSQQRAGTTGGLFQTPSRSNPPGGYPRARFLEESGGYSKTLPRVTSNGSPIRRKDVGPRIPSLNILSHAKRHEESAMLFNTRTPGGIYHSAILDESPVVRSAGKKRMREEADNGD